MKAIKFIAPFVLPMGFMSAAKALPLPDSSTCNTPNIAGCLRITNTNGAGFGTINGIATASGWGVVGEGSIGVRGLSTATSGGVGVSGITTNGTSTGVLGSSSAGIGVSGSSTSNVGVQGVITPAAAIAVGVQGVNSHPFGYAVFASGNLGVSGTPFCAGCTTFTNNSDLRLKKNVQPLSSALGTLLQLRPVTFEWKDPQRHNNLTGTQRGFIAQEVEKVLPEWVGVDEKGYKTLNTRGLEAMLVQSLGELKTENDELRARVQRLETALLTPAKRADSSPWTNPLLGILGLSAMGLVLGKKKRPERGSP